MKQSRRAQTSYTITKNTRATFSAFSNITQLNQLRRLPCFYVLGFLLFLHAALLGCGYKVFRRRVKTGNSLTADRVSVRETPQKMDQVYL